MTKATYRKRLNNYLTKVIRKFGFEHPATIHYAKQLENFIKAEPTKQNNEIMLQSMYATLRYGKDFKGV